LGEGQTDTPINHHNQGEVMTTRIEKTVFISYRRTNFPWAYCIYQDLTHHGYDVFFDYQSIDSGSFEKAILENIRARAHFIIILSQSALERFNQPSDWLRREIETAMDEKRNIIPVMLEGFDFGSPLVKRALTGKLASLNSYNGMNLVAEYIEAGFEKLRNRFLNVALEDVHLHVLTGDAKEITDSQKAAANEAAPVEIEQLTAQEWYERGYIFQEEKNLDEAIRCYTEAIRLYPNFAIAYNNRAAAYNDKGNPDAAIQDCAQAIRIKADYEYPYLVWGNALKDKGDFDSAIKYYTEAIRLKPDYAEAFNNRGNAHGNNKDLQDGLEDLDEAIRLKPDFAGAYNNRGNVQIGRNYLQDALNDYDEAIRLKPDFAEAYNNRGIARKTNNDLQDALNDFDEAIRLNPDFAPAYYNRGLARKDTNNNKGAIVDFSEAIRLHPGDHKAYIGRGQARSDSGEIDNAIADFTEAIKINPDLAEYYLGRGNLLSKKGDNLNALSDFQKASAIKTDNGSIRASLARVYKALGLEKEAKEQEEIARELITKEHEYNQACFEAISGNTDKAL